MHDRSCFEMFHHTFVHTLSFSSIKYRRKCSVWFLSNIVDCVLFFYFFIVPAQYKIGETMECKSNKNRQQIKSQMVQANNILTCAIFWIPNENGKRSMCLCVRYDKDIVVYAHMDERKFMVTMVNCKTLHVPFA